MPQKQFDFIMAGGGAAGLSLAFALARSSLQGASILVIDRDAKDRNDRTWCFWTDQPTPYDEIVACSWEELLFYGPAFESRIRLSPYTYRLIRGLDFYTFVRAQLANCPGVEFMQADILVVQDGTPFARVETDRGSFEARWVFDSRFIAANFAPRASGFHDLKQHFLGWEIETEQPAFDPRAATLFDFRVPQQGAMRFFYVLPLDTQHALVEFTLFSAQLLDKPAYETALFEYINKTLGIVHFNKLSEESAVIPMTDQPFTRKAGQRIMNIGTRGGRVKPSSGYAFKRILQDSDAIVNSLLKTGTPFQVPETPARYHWFDSILLQILFRQGDRASSIFTALFARNPIRRIFRFLDESGSPLENVILIASLPPGPFLRALLRIKVLRKI